MNSKTFAACLALTTLTAAALTTGDPTFSATANLGRHGLPGGEERSVRLLLEARGGPAADALAVRTPSVVRAVDDRGRDLKPHAWSWGDDLEYELVDRRFGGFPQGGLSTVLFLECPDGQVRNVTVEGALEMLAGGRDTALSFKKFESEEMHKLKNSALKKAGLQVEVRTEERQGLLLSVDTLGRDLDDVMLVNLNGSWAKGIDWQSSSSGNEGKLLIYVEGAKIPEGTALQLKVSGGGGANAITLLIKEVEGDKQGRELTDESLAAAGVQVIARVVVRPTLRVRIEGLKPLLHDLRLQVKGVRLEPSDLTAIDGEDRGDLLLTYDDPWPKGTVLVGRVRAGAKWVEAPFAVTDVAVD